MIRATQDIALWYETRKMALYAQLDVAIRNHEAEDQKAVIGRMVDLNKELAKQGWGAMSIQVQPVVNSLRQRARVRALQEGNLPAKTSQIPLTKQMLDLYPGMMQEIERKKVK
jgi:acyl carrier protein phosphodiesterase